VKPVDRTVVHFGGINIIDAIIQLKFLMQATNAPRTDPVEIFSLDS
jgi:hypothetical protein